MHVWIPFLALLERYCTRKHILSKGCQERIRTHSQCWGNKDNPQYENISLPKTIGRYHMLLYNVLKRVSTCIGLGIKLMGIAKGKQKYKRDGVK